MGLICCVAVSLHNMQSSPALARDVDDCDGVDGCGGSHPAVALPSLDADVLNQVRDLKHYPRRHRIQQSSAERKENELRDYIWRYWDKFQPSTRSKLELMKQESEELMKRLKARELLAEVREFGYRPRQIKKSNGDALLKQENSLARRIEKLKLKECLTPAELEEFNALPQKCRSDNSSGVQQPAATNEQQDDEHVFTQ